MIVSAWNPGELDQMALPPYHMMFQCFVRGPYLDLTMYCGKKVLGHVRELVVNDPFLWKYGLSGDTAAIRFVGITTGQHTLFGEFIR